MPGGIAGMLLNTLNKRMPVGSVGSMGGMGMMGGQPSGTQRQEQQESFSDEYDVDRWKRSDEDVTVVQQVRSHWEEEKTRKEEKKLSSRIKKKLSKLKKGGKKNKNTSYVHFEEPDIVGTTGGTKDLRPKKRDIEKAEHEAERVRNRSKRMTEMQNKNIMLKNMSNLKERSFFFSNPINSDILAMDTLSMGPLVLNQISSSYDNPELYKQNVVKENQKYGKYTLNNDLADEVGAETVERAKSGRVISFDAGYMDSIKEHRNNQKYDVKIL